MSSFRELEDHLARCEMYLHKTEPGIQREPYLRTEMAVAHALRRELMEKLSLVVQRVGAVVGEFHQQQREREAKLERVIRARK